MKEEWDKDEEARRLKARFASGLNKAEFARTYEVPGGASMLSQHLSGNRPLNMESAIAYAVGFNCTLKEISPRLAAIAESAIERGVVGERKLDLHQRQFKALLESVPEKDRDAAYLQATLAVSKFLPPD